MKEEKFGHIDWIELTEVASPVYVAAKPLDSTLHLSQSTIYWRFMAALAFGSNIRPHRPTHRRYHRAAAAWTASQGLDLTTAAFGLCTALFGFNKCV